MSKVETLVMMGEIKDPRLYDFLRKQPHQGKFWDDFYTPELPVYRPTCRTERGIPSLELFRQLLSLPNEVALTQSRYGGWSGSPGHERGVFLINVDRDPEIALHTHVISTGKEDLPSFDDIYNYFEDALVNGIVFPKGLIIYSLPQNLAYPNGLPAQYRNDWEKRGAVASKRRGIVIEEMEFRGLTPEKSITREEYVKLIEDLGIVWKIIPLEELTDEKLREIFNQ